MPSTVATRQSSFHRLHDSKAEPAINTAREDFCRNIENLTELEQYFDLETYIVLAIRQPIEQQNKMRKALEDMAYVVKTLKHRGQFSHYALINWAKIYFSAEDVDAKQLMTIITQNLELTSQLFDSGMTNVYLCLNFFGFVAALSRIDGMGFVDAINPLQNDTVNTWAGAGWNYFDACGGVALAARQFKQGEIAMGVANTIGSVQLTGCTGFAQSGYCAATTAANLMGFSFAACMAISCGIELYEVHKCEQRIEAYQNELTEIQENLRRAKKQLQTILDENISYAEALTKTAALTQDVTAKDAPAIDAPDKEQAVRNTITQYENRIQVLQKSIIFEKAQAENHSRSAVSWAGCAIAMTLIALGISTLGFGFMLPFIVASFAFLTGCIRKWAVNRVDYVAQAKATMNEVYQDAPGGSQSATAESAPQKFGASSPAASKISEKGSGAESQPERGLSAPSAHSSLSIAPSSNPPEKKLLERLTAAIDKNSEEIDFDKSVTIPGRLFFTSTQITLRVYLLDLLVTNPIKLKKILAALESPNAKSNLISVLNTARYCWTSKTRGAALYESLFPAVQMVVKNSSRESSQNDYRLLPSS